MADLIFPDSESKPYELCLFHSDKTQGEFLHTFGGPPRHQGIELNGGNPTVHLLFNIDLQDPLVDLPMLQMNYLALYHAFRFNAYCPLWYRLVSDDQIEIVRCHPDTWTNDFPYSEYPVEFPLRHANVSDKFRETFDEFLEDDNLDNWNELVEHCRGEGREPNFNDMAALMAYLPQGAPKSHCIECPSTEMNLFAKISTESDEVSGFSFWGKYGDDVEIYYEICPNCGLIRTDAQCT